MPLDCEHIILCIKKMNFAGVLKVANQLDFKKEDYSHFLRTKCPI